MFTGIIEAVGVVKSNNNSSLFIKPLRKLKIKKGDSLSINGVCLTVVDKKNEVLKFDVSPETLSRTNLGELKNGDFVNIETSLTLNKFLGGHIVQGHIDGVGKLTNITEEENSKVYEILVPLSIHKYLVEKAAISVDGVSLTIASLKEASFTVALIPYTLKNTNLRYKKIGDKLNIEVDIISKYVLKFLKEIDMYLLER
ncbi:MAG: riboflavin synthase [bacterium]|nr:riboflavin synthase [bacterium]